MKNVGGVRFTFMLLCLLLVLIAMLVIKFENPLSFCFTLGCQRDDAKAILLDR